MSDKIPSGRDFLPDGIFVISLLTGQELHAKMLQK